MIVGSPQNPNPWVLCPRPNPQARLRLFCLPYAGTGAAIYRLWVNDLPATVELCAVQLPGRETRLSEPAATDLAVLAPALADGLQPLFDRPFAIFGHSLGALIGFELTRLLHQRNQRPMHFFPSGRIAPHLPPPHPPIHHLPEPEFIAQIQERYDNTIPHPVLKEPDLLALLLPTLRADMTIHETYAFAAVGTGPVLTCPVTTFGGQMDRNVSLDALEAWSRHTRGPFAVHILSGGHFFLSNANQRAELIEMICTALGA